MIRFLKDLMHKSRYWKLSLFKRNFSVGNNFKLGKNCFVSSKNKIRIGENFFMGNYCHLSSNLEIGKNVMFASFVSCVGGDHNIEDINIKMNQSGSGTLKTTVIKDNVWIGHGAIIMHGVTIEEGSIVAAGSVVTKNISSFSIYGGNPSKLIRKR